MLSNVRKKMIQKNIKKYFELHINEWWNIDVGSGIFQYSHSGNQRYSKGKIDKSFENQSLDLVPYYKVNDGIYNMILCLRGSLIKGHPNLNKNPPQEIKIEKSFLLGETEITQELYVSVMGKNPSYFEDNPKNPVEQVSWYDAVIFCNRLSDIFGLDRYYTIGDAQEITDRNGKIEKHYPIEMNEGSKGFRLPTEWEWEYAAKARTPLEYSGSNDHKEVAWYMANSKMKTQPVKGRNPNAWGFYDMSGNVFEWCENRYDPTSTNLAIRGGGWSTLASGLCSATQNHKPPSSRYADIGFRVCKYI